MCTKNEDFDGTYLNIGSKTQNVEELSLDLIFHNNFWKNIKNFSKQNSKLRIHSKPDRYKSKLTVAHCTVHCDSQSAPHRARQQWWQCRGGIAVAATFSMAVGRGGSSNGCGGTHCTWGGDSSGARGGGVDYLCT